MKKSNINKLITLFEISVIFFSLLFLNNINDFNKKLYEFSENRVKMMQAADRLRHSSDELTHFARTYVVTNDEKYKENYFKVLSIRNGELARPLFYEFIYWDLDEKYRKQKHPSTQKLALNDIIKKLPFTKEEIEKLEISERNSNELVELEVEAFNAMIGLFKDENEKYTIRKKSNQELAIELLYSKDYFLAKKEIMNPIDDFMIMLNKRTINEEKIVKENISFHFNMFLLSILVFIVGNIFIYIYLNKKDKKAFENINKLLKDQEKLSNKLQDMNINLEKKIKAELKKSSFIEKKLHHSEKLASMGEMIGNIAHQWRQPLSVISTSATGIILQKKANVLDDEYLYKMCYSINTNAQYLSNTIDDFKNYIKGDREKTNFNVSALIKEFLLLMKTSINNNYINIKLELDEDINIDGYKNELRQCLINIYNNSKDVLSNLDEQDRFFHITLNKQGSFIIVTFLDNGGGIPQDILGKIFDPYFTTKHQSMGTGLGLHMTYRLIVEGMDGEIEAKNIEYEFNNKVYKCAQLEIKLPLVKLN